MDIALTNERFVYHQEGLYVLMAAGEQDVGRLLALPDCLRKQSPVQRIHYIVMCVLIKAACRVYLLKQHAVVVNPTL